MKPAITRLPSLPALASSMVLSVVVVVVIREWRLSRSHADRLQQGFAAALDREDHRSAVLSREIRAALKGLQADHALIRDQLEKGLRDVLGAHCPEDALTAGEPQVVKSAVQESVAGRDAPEPVDVLPEIPTGIPLGAIVRNGDLDGILRDSRCNPEGRSLSRVEQLRAADILLRARTELQRLESGLALGFAEEIERMREAGDFEYVAPGGRVPASGPDVLSAGESAEDGGKRMYYFFRDSHPELFAMKAGLRQTAEESVRRVLAMLQSE